MTVIPIFNPRHLNQNRARAKAKFKSHNFLFTWCENQINDRLSDIRRHFQSILITSPRTSPAFQKRPGANVTLIPFDEAETLHTDHSGPYDLVLSVLDLHTLNDLPGALIQIRKSLKPDGLFIGCLFGENTLAELRESMMEAELSTLGGASPHVFPLTTKQQMGALLQRSGFALPVVDSERIDVSYRDAFHLMSDLRGMGENNALNSRRQSFTPSRLFAETARLYAEKFSDSDGRITATFELIFLIGWAPDESQPKPLKPGSGKIHLGDVL